MKEDNDYIEVNCKDATMLIEMLQELNFKIPEDAKYINSNCIAVKHKVIEKILELLL